MDEDQDEDQDKQEEQLKQLVEERVEEIRAIAEKVHGSLARAGKVRGQTPKVAKQDKKKKPRGRAHKRMQYNRRFVTAGKILLTLGVFFPFRLN
ncbi:hypothetical protein SAY86_013531 [Trapa natans]|uniref:40S ribosomal protein S30 n=1 Tax=Trapa natans TaxID=22666 RepID=A0AAN7KYS5_TRANT|nr:hypothetical protein SAY86_013531 [Trapa natans]